jgi:trk system potassium uptake protein TrkA
LRYQIAWRLHRAKSEPGGTRPRIRRKAEEGARPKNIKGKTLDPKHMRIIIVGAGDIGFHLAHLLSNEQQDITLIDNKKEVLDLAGQKLDVLTVYGDGSSFATLEEASIRNVDLFISVTTSEKTNLISCILAKEYGAKQTIARVNQAEYLVEKSQDTFRKLGVDVLFSPRALAAQEIERLIEHPYFTDVFDFEDGLFSLCGLYIEQACPVIDKTIAEIAMENEGLAFRPIAILRENQTLIPRGPTKVLLGDQIFFLNPRGKIQDLIEVFGLSKRKIQNIMMIGGQDIARLTADRLEGKYRVKLIDDNRSMCKELAEELSHTLILHGDPTNFELLREESLSTMDCFIALTQNTEANILSSMMARNIGVGKTISLVENAAYIRLSHNIGIDTLINKKLIAANHIFRFVRKGKVAAITTLSGVNAEVIEFIIDHESKLTKHAIHELKFPDEALIGGVIRNEEALIPGGNFKMKVGDKVIIFALPEAIRPIEKMFK